MQSFNAQLWLGGSDIIADFLEEAEMEEVLG